MTKNQIRQLGERHAVRGLLAFMATRGWLVAYTWDGEERQITVGNADAVMAAAFNLDEVSLRFAPRKLVEAYQIARGARAAAKAANTCTDAEAKALTDAAKAAREACEQAERGVLLVFGNSAEEVIADEHPGGWARRYFFAQA